MPSNEQIAAQCVQEFQRTDNLWSSHGMLTNMSKNFAHAFYAVLSIIYSDRSVSVPDSRLYASISNLREILEQNVGTDQSWWPSEENLPMVPQRVCNTLIDEYGWLQSEKDPNRPGYYLYSLTSTGITAIDTIDSLSAKHDYATGTLMQTVSNNMDMLVAADGSREKQIEQVTKSIEMLEERRNRLLAGERVYLMDDEKYQNECITLIGELKYFPASLRKTAEDLAEIRRDFQKKVLDTPYSGADISELYRMKDSILESTEGGRNFRDVQAIINNTSESRLSATMDCILSSDRLQSNPSLKRDLDYAWRSVLNSVLYVIDQLVKTQSLVANCLASLMNDNMLITYEKLHETSEMVRAWYAQARPRDYVELPNYMLRLNTTHLRTNFYEEKTHTLPAPLYLEEGSAPVVSEGAAKVYGESDLYSIVQAVLDHMVLDQFGEINLPATWERLEPRIRRLNDANALVCAILSTEGFSTGKASWLMVHPSGKKEAYLGPDIHIPIPALKRIGGVPDEQPRQ